jgi:hypothetical protein
MKKLLLFFSVALGVQLVTSAGCGGNDATSCTFNNTVERFSGSSTKCYTPTDGAPESVKITKQNANQAKYQHKDNLSGEIDEQGVLTFNNNVLTGTVTNSVLNQSFNVQITVNELSSLGSPCNANLKVRYLTGPLTGTLNYKDVSNCSF